MKTLILFYWSECGHCAIFRPEWEKLKKELVNSDIQTKEYEYNKNREIINKYKIMAFPTLLLIENRNITEVPIGSMQSIKTFLDKKYNEKTPLKSKMSGGSSNYSTLADPVILYAQRCANKFR